jgi:hypothetical protein
MSERVHALVLVAPVELFLLVLYEGPANLHIFPTGTRLLGNRNVGLELNYIPLRFRAAHPPAKNDMG